MFCWQKHPYSTVSAAPFLLLIFIHSHDSPVIFIQGKPSDLPHPCDMDVFLSDNRDIQQPAAIQNSLAALKFTKSASSPPSPGSRSNVTLLYVCNMPSLTSGGWLASLNLWPFSPVALCRLRTIITCVCWSKMRSERCLTWCWGSSRFTHPSLSCEAPCRHSAEHNRRKCMVCLEVKLCFHF